MTSENIAIMFMSMSGMEWNTFKEVMEQIPTSIEKRDMLELFFNKLMKVEIKLRYDSCPRCQYELK